MHVVVCSAIPIFLNWNAIFRRRMFRKSVWESMNNTDYLFTVTSFTISCCIMQEVNRQFCSRSCCFGSRKNAQGCKWPNWNDWVMVKMPSLVRCSYQNWSKKGPPKPNRQQDQQSGRSVNADPFPMGIQAAPFNYEIKTAMCTKMPVEAVWCFRQCSALKHVPLIVPTHGQTPFTQTVQH